MYTITLNRDNHPTAIYFHGFLLTQKNTLKVTYLTREIVEAFEREYVYISPIPSSITPTVLQVSNSTGGVISEEIGPITNFTEANNAISTLLEQYKRLTIDTLALVEDSNQMKQQLLDIESRLQ